MSSLVLLVLLLVAPFAIEAQTVSGHAASMPENVNLRRILERPDVIASMVTSMEEGDKTWIGMEIDVHATTAIPLQRLRTLLTDFSGYHQILRRVTSSRVSGTTERGTLLSLEVTVRAMGVTVVTNYTILKEIIVDTPDRFHLSFTHFSDDNTIRNIHGYYYLEMVEIDGMPHTYIRYYAYQDSLQTNGLQRQVTSMFIGSEHTRMLRDILALVRQ